jgi:choline kinase
VTRGAESGASVPIRRAILIAAGRGKRLGPHTAELPKCLVPVGARPILGWAWRALAAAGIDELVVIRGYRGEALEAAARQLGSRVHLVENRDWETNNILHSLRAARAFLDQPCLITYSDIIFTPAVARAAATSPAEIGLVIDREFRRIYDGRTEHPLDEGEVADLMPDGTVARVGKRALPPAEAVGEYIGLTRLGPRGVAATARTLEQLDRDYEGRLDAPFQRAAHYRSAYLTDLWQHMIDRGLLIDPIFIAGQWREIDTGQDLARASELIESSPEEWS